MSEETTLIGAAVAQLQALLPHTWEVSRSQRSTSRPNGSVTTFDSVIELRGPTGESATVVVDARDSFSPRDAQSMLGGLAGVIRSFSAGVAVLAVAPWMSRRTQELLAENGINSLDLTGNARLSISYPLVFIRSEGATRNPNPSSRGQARLRGPKAGRLIRLLVGVVPPYRVSEIAAATGLAPGYVSRLLDALDREALVERSKRGAVAAVDIEALLQRWAESYDVFKSNKAHTFLAPGGPSEAFSRMTALEGPDSRLITGSFAAARLAPLAAPALLVAYAKDVTELAKRLGLLPADEGSNVVLLESFDPVVWEEAALADGVWYAAPPQVAVDCLTGTGRMPAEGQALIDWMIRDQDAWRADSIHHFLAAR